MSVIRSARPRRATALGALAVLVLGGGFTVATASTARADYTPSAAFDGYAQGIAVNATMRNQSLPLGLVIEGVGPEASSRLTSTGQSDGEASFPYLGPVVPGLPGIAAGLYGFPSPGYPLQAATGAGEAPADVAYPGIKLHAESGQSSNVGTASVVSESGGGSAGSRITVRPSGDVEAAADSALDAIVIGGTVRMSGVHSTASVLADGTTGKLTRYSSLSIARLHIPGLAIAVPKNTPESAPVPVPIPGAPQLPNTPFPPIPLPFGGQTLPAPDIGFKDGYFSMTLPGFGDSQYAIPASSVLDALKKVGYLVTYQPATATPTGIEGASFSFSYEAPGFPDNPYFSGPVPITYTVGKVLANVTLNPVTLAATTQTPAGATQSTVDGAASPALLPTLDAGAVPGLVPAGAPLGAPASVETGTGVRPATFVPAAASRVTKVTGMYLLFPAVALAALLSMTALSLVGVRSPWKS